MAAGPSQESSVIINLSKLNFELLEKYFLKSTKKNTIVQSLNDKIGSAEKLKNIKQREPVENPKFDAEKAECSQKDVHDE
jgi:hypothetical protein